MLRALPALFALASLALVGCPGTEGPLDEGPHCEDTPTEVALDEQTALGFSAQDVLARLPASEAPTLLWADDSTTGLALAFRPAASARFVDSEAVYPKGNGETPAIGVVCDDRVEVDLSWDFATADGAFDETFDTPLKASTVDAAWLAQAINLDHLHGSFDLDDWVTEPYDERSAEVQVDVEDGATRGAVMGQISGQGACTDGDTCTAWAAEIPVGTWGAGQ